MRQFLSGSHLLRPSLYLVLLFLALAAPYVYEVAVCILDEWQAHEALRLGMTLHQVLASVGKPPGDYGPVDASYAKWSLG